MATDRWLDTLAARAREELPPPVWRYVEAGAREEVTLAEAGRGWRDVRLWPRVLAGVREVELSTTLLGTPVATPVAVAPTSMQRAIHPEGERAVLTGAAAAGARCVLPSNAGFRFDELDAGEPWWLQAYLPPDRDLALPVLERAVAAGAAAVALTVDTPFPGTKYGVDDADWADIDLSWWRCNFEDPASARWAGDLRPDDLGWLREHTGLPVVAKGVLRPDDARRAVDAGASAVWVSNHGGRQLDRVASTASALPLVADAVGADAEVYVDGGVRSGDDVLAALALGADAVFVGRPVLYALADSGAEGVGRLLTELSEELREGLHLAGCATPQEARGLRFALP